jgi:Obg family GTPase CgtA-like protein
VNEHRKQEELLVDESEKLPVIKMRENEDIWTITEKKRYIVISGTKIVRFARRTDFESEDGVRRLRDIMRKMGIVKQLEKRR